MQKAGERRLVWARLPAARPRPCAKMCLYGASSTRDVFLPSLPDARNAHRPVSYALAGYNVSHARSTGQALTSECEGPRLPRRNHVVVVGVEPAPEFRRVGETPCYAF